MPVDMFSRIDANECECVPLFTCGMFFYLYILVQKCTTKLYDIKIEVNKIKKVYLKLRSCQREVKAS